MKRLGWGHYGFSCARDESVDSRHDDASNESWLHGHFIHLHVVYRQPAAPNAASCLSVNIPAGSNFYSAHLISLSALQNTKA